MSAAPDIAPSPRRSWRQQVGIPLNVLLFLLLMVMAWGSVRGFFAHPARAIMAALLVASIPIMTLSTSGRSRGVAHASDDRRFFPLLVAHSLLTAWVMPYMDARSMFVLPGGDLLRWLGLALFALGIALRAAAMLTLGGRFASVVAVQESHRLHTRGVYAWVRHPSYLGIYLMDLGYAALFRSIVALLALPVVVWMFERRMALEERFMVEQFGDEYRAYMARVPRVLPGVR